MRCSTCAFEFEDYSLGTGGQIAFNSVSCRRPGCTGFAHQVVHVTYLPGHSEHSPQVAVDRPPGVELGDYERGVEKFKAALSRERAKNGKPHITEFLAVRYKALHDALGRPGVRSDTSPWAQWNERLRKAPSEAEEKVKTYAERSSTQAIAAVRQHVRLLSRAYWANLENPVPEDPADWPSESIYPPARAALEGLATVGWLIRSDVTDKERLLRIGELMADSDPKQWNPVLKELGIAVEFNQERNRWCVKREDQEPKVLTHNRKIADLLGAGSQSIYGPWSDLSHSNPRRTAELSLWLESADGEEVFATILREDEHLIVLADLADAIGTAGQRVVDYYGRPADELPTICRTISQQCRREADFFQGAAAEREKQQNEEQDQEPPGK